MLPNLSQLNPKRAPPVAARDESYTFRPPEQQPCRPVSDIIDVLADGNCFFYAIARLAWLHNHPKKEWYGRQTPDGVVVSLEDANRLRTDLIQYMRANVQDFSRTLEQESDLFTSEARNAYFDRMKEPYQWAGIPEAEAASKFFNVRIIVWQIGAEGYMYLKELLLPDNKYVAIVNDPSNATQLEARKAAIALQKRDLGPSWDLVSNGTDHWQYSTNARMSYCAQSTPPAKPSSAGLPKEDGLSSLSDRMRNLSVKPAPDMKKEEVPQKSPIEIMRENLRRKWLQYQQDSK